MPLFLGGVTAAALGAGAGIWAAPQVMPWLGQAGPGANRTPAAGAEAARAAIAAQPAASADTAALEAQIAEIRAAIPPASPPVDLAPLQQRLDALQAELAEIEQRPVSQGGAPADLTALESRLDALESRTAASGPDSDQLAQRLAALEKQVQTDGAQAQTRLAQIDKQVQDSVAKVEAAAAQAQEKVSQAQSQAEALREQAAETGRKAQGAAAVALLQAAMNTGAGRQAALADLHAAGVAVPASLMAAKLPTLAQLRADWDAAARAALAASLRATATDNDTVGRIGNFLRVQTGARSVAPRDGADADAILSRAGAAVSAGNIDAALSEIALLPDAGQAALKDWTGLATAYAQANRALADLAGRLK